MSYVELLSYNGLFEPETIYEMVNTLKTRLDVENAPCKKKRATLAIVVEQANNIIMHSAEREGGLARGILQVGICDDLYCIKTTNAIKAENGERISKQIDHLATLDKKQIFKLYKENLTATVRNGLNPESKGAGIGIYEIAWRAQSAIMYKLTPRDDGLMDFYMHVHVAATV